MKQSKTRKLNSVGKNKTKKGQLFSNNHPETTVHGYGFDTIEHVKSTLTDLHNRDIDYQFQVVNTMHERAKVVLSRTKDPAKQKKIRAGIPLLKAWLTDYTKKHRHEKEYNIYLPVSMVNKLEPLAEFYNVSRKARGLEKPTKSDEGFLTVYRRVGEKHIAKLRTMPVKASNPMGETWDKHRNNYIVRRRSMLRNAGPAYGLYHTEGPLKGLPKVLHVNMLMWAYTPDIRLLEMHRFNKLIEKMDEIIAKYKTIANLGKKYNNL